MREFVLLILFGALLSGCGSEDTSVDEVSTESSLCDIEMLVVEPGLDGDGTSDMFVVFISDLGDYEGCLSLEYGNLKSDMFSVGDYYFIKLGAEASESDIHVVSSDRDDLGTLDKISHIDDRVNLHNLVQEVIKTDAGYVYLDIFGTKFTVNSLTQRGNYSGRFAMSGDIIYYIDEFGEQSVMLK